MPGAHQQELTTLAATYAFRGKGPLSVVLVLTQYARNTRLPIDPQSLVTEGGGQVLGLGSGAVQSILKRYGITKTLAREGGRTSRGSLNKMRMYVAFLNQLHAAGPVDFDSIEAFWIERVRDFFSGQPFRVRLDSSRSLRTLVGDLVQQAIERRKANPGNHYAGAVLQHLVGAKLACALTPATVQHHSFSTADEPSGRPGDFLIGDVVIHVTTSPTESTIQNCLTNLNDGYRPMIVTTQRGLPLAEGLAANAAVADRIDVFEIEQFVALNLYELGKFAADGRRTAVAEVIERYNRIVETVETDPSLKIEFRK